VRLAPVHDVRRRDAALERVQAGLELWTHAARGLAIRSRTSAAVASEILVAGSSGSARQPSTSVRKITFAAPSAAATAAAAASALTL